MQVNRVNVTLEGKLSRNARYHNFVDGVDPYEVKGDRSSGLLPGINAGGHEGNVAAPVGAPFPISYRSIIPRKEECSNLLVPVCLSASHIAFGSIRMEPVFMVLGQSSAIAASLAIDSKVGLQDLPYEKLKQALIDNKQYLTPAKSE